eukprot:2007106-Prymnesium_polylepis.1
MHRGTLRFFVTLTVGVNPNHVGLLSVGFSHGTALRRLRCRFKRNVLLGGSSIHGGDKATTQLARARLQCALSVFACLRPSHRASRFMRVNWFESAV